MVGIYKPQKVKATQLLRQKEPLKELVGLASHSCKGTSTQILRRVPAMPLRVGIWDLGSWPYH